MHRSGRCLVLLVLAAALAACATDGSDGPKDESRRTSEAPSSPSSSSSSAPPSTGIAPAFFGVHDHDPVTAGPTGWPAAPVGSLRAWDAGVTWREIETAPGQFTFDRLDALVDNAEANESDVLLVLGQTPGFHATDPDAEGFYGPGASSPPKLAAWKKYVRTVAERYAGRPVVLQVWNEANVVGFWSGDQQQMADLTKATHDAVADVDPRPTIVAPALVTRLSGQRSWINTFFATKTGGRPVADYVDVVALQLYPAADGTPDSSMELLAAMRTVLASHQVDKPIWNTEINYGLTGTEVKPAPQRRQQTNVVATYVLNAVNGVDRVYWYGWDQQSIVDTLLSRPDGSVTKAGKAFTTVQRWLVGTTPEKCTTAADGTYACPFKAPGGTTRTVYWHPTGTGAVTVPDGATTVQRIGGDEGPATAGESLTVDLPVMVESQG